MKSKVTKITKMDKKDTYGNTSFIIEFETGDKGFYTSKTEDQKKFIVGNVADYEIEVKQGTKGPYNKITVPSDKPAFVGARPSVDPKVSMISFSMSYAKDLIVGGKVPITELDKEFNRIYNLMVSKL